MKYVTKPSGWDSPLKPFIHTETDISPNSLIAKILAYQSIISDRIYMTQELKYL